MTTENKTRVIGTVMPLLDMSGKLASLAAELIQHLLDLTDGCDSIESHIDDWNESDHPRGRDGKFISGSGESGGGAQENKETSEAVRPRGKTPKLQDVESSKSFRNTFLNERNKIEPDRRWRVSADYSETDYDGMKKYVNENGSTFALHGTDIVSVVANGGAGDRGSDIIADAVAAGGNKLDAYSGIYRFYQKCGFEPVSWTEWDDEYANEDWLAVNGFTRETWMELNPKPKDEDLRLKREPIVFFKYTGNASKTSLEDFKKSVKPLPYDEAYAERDKHL